MEIDQFREYLDSEIVAKAEAYGILEQEAFFDVAFEYLIACGELSEANYSHHQQTGIQVDGYGGPPADEDGTLKLLLVDYSPDTREPQTLTTSDVKAIINRGRKFLRKILSKDYLNSLEESSDVFRLGKFIHAHWGEILKVRFILITNRKVSARFDPNSIPLGTITGETPCLLSIWDTERIFQIANQGMEQEPITIDFDTLGYDISVLRASSDANAFTSYIAVLPGAALADIYDKYGTRLLEQNVRVYLQARGKVNRGIQTTILDEPNMFFSFNNGLTATVEDVEVVRTGSGLSLKKLRNLQIVNGGQTAASIYLMSQHSKKRWKRGWAPDLSAVDVMMKLSVIPPEFSSEVVPKISRFANSQNAISDADFFSNHPFHVELERLANRIFAPARENNIVQNQTKWFYERMRGQYQNARSNLFGAELKEFDVKTPRSQVITKTDLAKFLLPWDGLPEIAQRGAAKSFSEFAKIIEKAWDKNSAFCNDIYFKSSVAKAIIFRQLEAIVSKQPWYEGGGNRAPIVIHTLGKLQNDLQNKGLYFPFNKIWDKQKVPPEIESVLSDLSTFVKDYILHPPREGQLPTEWAKTQACTVTIAAAPFRYPTEFLSEMVPITTHRELELDARKDQKLTEQVSAEIFVARQGPAFWQEFKDWADSRGYANAKDKSILSAAISGIPSERQAQYVRRMWDRLSKEGCPLKLPDNC